MRRTMTMTATIERTSRGLRLQIDTHSAVDAELLAQFNRLLDRRLARPSDAGGELRLTAIGVLDGVYMVDTMSITIKEE